MKIKPNETHISQEIVNEISSIINKGNKAEVEYGRDGVKVLEIRKKVKYPKK